MFVQLNPVCFSFTHVFICSFITFIEPVSWACQFNLYWTPERLLATRSSHSTLHVVTSSTHLGLDTSHTLIFTRFGLPALTFLWDSDLHGQCPQRLSPPLTSSVKLQSQESSLAVGFLSSSPHPARPTCPVFLESLSFLHRSKATLPQVLTTCCWTPPLLHTRPGLHEHGVKQIQKIKSWTPRSLWTRNSSHIVTCRTTKFL